MVALIAEITSYFELDMCLMTRRMETLNLMPLGRQLELIITSIKAIDSNLLWTDLANSEQKWFYYLALRHSFQ